MKLMIICSRVVGTIGRAGTAGGRAVGGLQAAAARSGKALADTAGAEDMQVVAAGDNQEAAEEGSEAPGGSPGPR